jgi:hypothetical protein
MLARICIESNLKRGCSTCGWPDGFMRPAATFLNYILYKLQSNLKSYFNCYSATSELAYSNVCGLLPKNIGHPWFKYCHLMHCMCVFIVHQYIDTLIVLFWQGELMQSCCLYLGRLFSLSSSSSSLLLVRRKVLLVFCYNSWFLSVTETVMLHDSFVEHRNSSALAEHGWYVTRLICLYNTVSFLESINLMFQLSLIS